MHRHTSRFRWCRGSRKVSFETEEDFVRLAPVARAAVADDPFDVWEQREIDGFRLVEV